MQVGNEYTTFGSSPAAINLNKMLIDEYPTVKSNATALMNKFYLRLNEAANMSETNRIYMCDLILKDFKRVVSETTYPEAVKTHMLNVMKAKYRMNVGV